MNNKESAPKIPVTENEGGVVNDQRFWQRGQLITHIIQDIFRGDQEQFTEFLDSIDFDYSDKGIEHYMQKYTDILHRATKEQLDALDKVASKVLKGYRQQQESVDKKQPATPL